tara:strand:- start:310 stop:666 length:357 start_codon:yes stop_codon:yes gene_type:complete
VSTFYEEMQGTATELLAEYQQGTVTYNDPGTPTGPEWDPTPGTPTSYAVNATVRGVQQKYIADGYINASDLQAMVSVFDVEPTTSGTLTVDGREHQIIQVDAIPAAGTVVAWRVFIKS